MGDDIRELPIDDIKTNQSDLEMVDTLFKNKEQVNNFAKQFKDAFIGGLLFLVFASPQVDKFIRSCGCQSEAAVWAIKFILFFVLFFIAQKKL